MRFFPPTTLGVNTIHHAASRLGCSRGTLESWAELNNFVRAVGELCGSLLGLEFLFEQIFGALCTMVAYFLQATPIVFLFARCARAKSFSSLFQRLFC